MSEICPTVPRKYHASMQIYKFLVVKERQEERKTARVVLELGGVKIEKQP